MKYLLRVNLDIKDEKIRESLRFKSVVFTVKKISKKNNKIIILSHRGRPNGFDKKLSLKPIAKLLSEAIEKKIIFIPDFDFPSIKNRIDQSINGSILMIENLRFLGGEQNNNRILSRTLAGLGDVFINDDFATAHRKNASNVGITEFIKSIKGPVFENEIKSLTRVIRQPKHPFLLVIGGAKMSDKLGVMNNLIKRVDNVVLGGGVANTFLKAQGFDIDKSIFEPEVLGLAKKMAKNRKIIMPVDYKKIKDRILDIGPRTIKIYSKLIRDAKTIIWGGPLGLYEDKRFSHGSFGVAKAISKSKAFAVVGGGETSQIIMRLGLEDKIDLVSTGGGAMLDFLAGKKMPAIDALKNKNRNKK